ncbi:MAG: hypothetical protein IPK85_08450 [Gemmatimonadetes bacterium]|nr:hypothetical protein [Gemmatimonadota bacterium]
MTSPTRRLWGARLLLSFFALFWAESFVLPSCPMHRDMVQHGSHGGHDSSDQQPTTDCDCLGSCVSSEGVGLAKAPFVFEIAAPRALTVAVDRAIGVAPTVDQLHLPEAQGPPASA